MPRRPRDVSPGFHHVWVGATGRWEYFSDDVDRIAWIRLLAAVVKEMGWRCVAFCQMSTHVHLLLDIPDCSLAVGMRELNRDYSCAFNGRHSRYGTFVRQRFGSRRIEGGSSLLTVYSYVALNPVAGGLCLRPEEWRWSSYRTTVGVARDFPFVDASAVVGEAGGTSGALRRAVESAARARLEQTRPEPGSGRVWRS
jgi:REP element-mobilizing transposase RayT